MTVIQLGMDVQNGRKRVRFGNSINELGKMVNFGIFVHFLKEQESPRNKSSSMHTRSQKMTSLR